MSAFVFATRIVQFLYFIDPKFPASNHLLRLYSPVCVGPGRNPNCWVSHAHAHLLQIKDYFGSESKRLCDYDLPPAYTSSTNALLVKYFVSEIYYTVWNKFQIQYRHVSGKNIWAFIITLATREKTVFGVSDQV